MKENFVCGRCGSALGFEEPEWPMPRAVVLPQKGRLVDRTGGMVKEVHLASSVGDLGGAAAQCWRAHRIWIWWGCRRVVGIRTGYKEAWHCQQKRYRPTKDKGKSGVRKCGR